MGIRRKSRAHTYCLCRARQVTNGDQTTTWKDTQWYQCLQSLSLSMAQTVFGRFLGPTKLKDYCKTFCNHGKFDIICVKFTTAWCSPDCEWYCTVKQHCSSIYTLYINWTYVQDKWVQLHMKCIRLTGV